ncbi:MAG: DUF3810 domain-containing protein [Christensenellales bacterium]|jgi:hypothetical protein
MNTPASFLKKYRARHILLAALFVLNLLYFLLRRHRGLMTLITDHVTGPFKRFIAWICSVYPYSVAEILVVASVLFAVYFIAVGTVQIVRSKGRRAHVAYRRVTALVCMALFVFSGFNVLWGINYYAETFQQRSGITAGRFTRQHLYETTVYFAQKCNETASLVSRDETGLYNEPLDQVLADGQYLYRDTLEEEFPFLKGRALKAKPVLFSRFMSRTRTTGVAFPFTGESNVNVDSPQVFLPSAIAHETAHQRNIASEQESNFLAVLACVRSEHAAYRYSGYLLGFRLLASSLLRQDTGLYLEVYDSLSREVRRDLHQNDVYWLRYQGKLSEISEELYDDLLKSHGQELGTKSYGAAVDLIITYFYPMIDPLR